MLYFLLTLIFSPFALLRLLLIGKKDKPQKILFVQTAKIGDYIASTALIRALRLSYPDAQISLLVSTVAEPLARHQVGVHQVFSFSSAKFKGFSGRLFFYRFLRTHSFDTFICISPNQTYLLLPFLAGIQNRASVLPNFGGLTSRLSSLFVNYSIKHQQGKMLIESGMQLLHLLGVKNEMFNTNVADSSLLPSGEGFGMRESAPKTVNNIHEIYIKEINAAPNANERIQKTFPQLFNQQNMRWIGLGISSGNKLKSLSEEQLIFLAKHILSSQNCGLVLIGGKEDQTLAKNLLGYLSNTNIIDTSGQVNLEDLPALIDKLSLYIGVDSGITYLADARNIPVIDYMGPADSEDQRPTGKKAIIIQSTEPCAPCSHAFLAPYSCRIGTRACIKNASLEQILKAIDF